LTGTDEWHKIWIMKIFVTGGTGFIGSHFIESLADREDIKIFALIRDPNRLKWLEGLTVHLLPGDLENIPRLPADIDYVFHIAGSTKARKSADYYTVNQEGTASLFRSLKDQGLSPSRVVVLSSLAAAGPCQDGCPVREDCDPRPVSPYGLSKLAGERAALDFRKEFPIALVRVGPVFGPRDPDHLALLKFVRRGILPSFGIRARKISFCYVKDLAKALGLCMEREMAGGQILHVGDPQPYTYQEFLRAAGEVMEAKLRRITFPLPLVWFAALFSEWGAALSNRPKIFDRQKVHELRQEAWVADTDHTRRLLGFEPDFTLREALEETIAWYRAHNRL